MCDHDSLDSAHPSLSDRSTACRHGEVELENRSFVSALRTAYLSRLATCSQLQAACSDTAHLVRPVRTHIRVPDKSSLHLCHCHSGPAGHAGRNTPQPGHHLGSSARQLGRLCAGQHTGCSRTAAHATSLYGGTARICVCHLSPGSRRLHEGGGVRGPGQCLNG